ncbi:MAG: oligosaccharide flippase family protein [Actinomycetota bacterium]|nr:oligosaccharide flippase family protein [Actinomycetota bacterium]
MSPVFWRTFIGTSRYRREALTSSIMSMAGFSIGIITGPILARAVGPTGRGEIAAVVQAAWLLGWLLCFGLPLAAAYWLDDIPEGELLATTATFGIIFGGIVSAILWFVAPIYLAGQSGEALVWAKMFLLVLPLSAGVNTALEIRRRRGADLAWNRWRIAPPVVSAVGIVILALLGRLSVAGALACYFVGGLLPLLYFFLRVRSSSNRRPSVVTLRRLLPYAWRTAAQTGASSITGRLDQVVLATAVPSKQLGFYAVAVTTSSITNTLTIGLPLALFGHQRGDTQADRSTNRYRRSMVATLTVSSCAALILGVLAPIVLRIAFGRDFQQATLSLRILLPGAVAFDLLGLMASKLSADGRVGEVTRAAVVGAVVTIAGLLAVVPRFGIEGAAAVTSVTYASQVGYLLARDRVDVARRTAKGRMVDMTDEEDRTRAGM